MTASWARLSRLWRIVAAVLVGLAVLLLLIGAWRLLTAGPRTEAVRARAEGTLAAGATKAAGAALETTERVHGDEQAIERRLDAGNSDIAAAEGGEQALPPAVAAAALRSLCLHAAYRDDPRCAAM